jgi:gluconolactonase
MSSITDVATGLLFPEGPIAMPDGSVVLVEMFGPCLSRIHTDGSKEVIAEIPGGPNGAALGPNGLFYVCNNGGVFKPMVVNGNTVPVHAPASEHIGGRIQTVDPQTGKVTDLYAECDGVALTAPNDIVFDDHGGFYFTDHGFAHGRTAVMTGIYYAKADGSMIKEIVFPARDPNGIGLSPDGATLYWAETWTGRIIRRKLSAPGVIENYPPGDLSMCLHGFPGFQLLDSLAVDAAGNVCVATLMNGGVSVVSPDGELIDFVATGDPLTTNVCFGGPDLQTAYITLSGSGRLVTTPWPRPGLALAHLNK